MQIKFGPIRNIKELQAFLKTAPRGTIRVIVKAFTEYIIGDENHGLRHDQPYKFASRAKAYGKVSDAPPGYFSMAQFRKVAALTKGFTVFGRKNDPTKASGGYSYKETRGGYGATITNEQPSAYWTRSDKGQPRQIGMVGWRKYTKIVEDNTKGAIRSAVAAVNRFLREKGK